MKRDARSWGSGLALALGCLLLGTSANSAAEDKGPAVPLSDDDFNRLVGQASKLIDDALKGKPNDPAIEQARTAAALIAAIAQYSQDANNGPRRATLRAAALRLVETIDKSQFEAARTAAGALPKLPVDAKAPQAPVQLIGKQVVMADVMHHFAGVKGGGTGGEKKLLDLGDNKVNQKNAAVPANDLNEDLILLALRAAVAGELVKGHQDAKVKAAPVLWKQYAEEMRQGGLDLAKAAQGKNPKMAWTALNKLNASCNDCHNKFK